MKVTCKFNRSLSLPDEQRGRLVDFGETYPLTIGAKYFVLGMAVLGYDELVNHPEHLAALEKREPLALSIFKDNSKQWTNSQNTY